MPGIDALSQALGRLTATVHDPERATENLLERAGELREAYEAVDWAAGPLGPMDEWSDVLRHTVALMLDSRFPVTLFWGPERVMVYNQAYVDLIGDKHPSALGARAEEVFAEAWPILGPLMEQVDETGEATWTQDALVPLERRGFVEDCWFTFSFSPVRDEDGVTVGVADIAVETSEQVLSRRRLELVARLGQELGDVEDLDELPSRLCDVLAGGEDVVDVELLPDGQRRAPGGLPATRPRAELGARDLLVEERPEGAVAWMPLRSYPSPRPRAARVGADGAPPAVLVARLNPRLAPDRGYRIFLRLIASALDHALGRIAVREAERRAAHGDRQLSAALQRALLTRPMAPDHLRVAVRYEPASDVAQIGGDWHDSFLLPSGALAIAVGDVAGHDREAAAAMGQARNLLRGIWFARPEARPGAVLATLDGTIQDLSVATTATAVLARVEQSEEDAAAGLRRLRWSNAGHPPPVLIDPEGAARVLEAAPERLLGLSAADDRGDHEVVLRPGSHVVFYTDGLVERRGAAIDDGIAWLVDTLQGTQALDPEQIADLLMHQVRGAIEDDVALLVLHALPEPD